MARLSEADLRACALGYRAKNLLGSARMIAEGQVDLLAVAKMEDAAARAELCRLPGDGEKVAKDVENEVRKMLLEQDNSTTPPKSGEEEDDAVGDD